MGLPQVESAAVTVGELIKELQTFPRCASVGWRDHDCDDDRISAHVNTVSDFNEETSFDPEFCENIQCVLGS